MPPLAATETWPASAARDRRADRGRLSRAGARAPPADAPAVSVPVERLDSTEHIDFPGTQTLPTAGGAETMDASAKTSRAAVEEARHHHQPWRQQRGHDAGRAGFRAHRKLFVVTTSWSRLSGADKLFPADEVRRRDVVHFIRREQFLRARQPRPRRRHHKELAMRAKILRDQHHCRAVAAMAGDDDELLQAAPRDVLADCGPSLQPATLGRQRLRARKVDMLGGNPRPVQRAGTSPEQICGQQLAHAREIRVRDPARRSPSGRCGPCCSVAASGSTAIQRDTSARLPSRPSLMSIQSRDGPSSWFLCPNLSAYFGVIRGRGPGPGRVPELHAVLSQLPLTSASHDRRSAIMTPPLICGRALTASLMAAFALSLAPVRAGAGQGFVRHELGRRSRAWRVLSGCRGWHL